MRGTTFLYWREEDTCLIFLAKENDNFSAISSGLIRDGSSLGMIIGDDEGNVEQLQYNPGRSLKR